MEGNAVALVSDEQHLRSESRADELAAHAAVAIVRVGAALLCRDLLEHLGDGCTILGIEVCVNFVEEVKGCWVTLLNGEDEGKCTQTWEC